jgi:uncharacterized protein (TIGR02246 family)
MYRPLSANAHQATSYVDVESTIRNLTQDYCTAFNTGNYDQVAALFAADGVCLAPNREAAVGTKEIDRVLRQLGDEGYQNLRLETTRVDHSADTAIEIGRYSVTRSMENGTSIAERGKFLRVWRRLGTWSLTAAAWNSSTPIPLK